MIVGPDLAAGSRTQRRDRHGPGIVRVVLADIAGGQQPDPGTQLRLHVQHALARRDELLGQQVTQAAGALDGPGPLGPARRPLHQLAGLGRGGADPQPAQWLLGHADRHRGMRGLVRIDPDHHGRHGQLQDIIKGTGNRGGHA
jgi:hypothetical protein